MGKPSKLRTKDRESDNEFEDNDDDIDSDELTVSQILRIAMWISLFSFYFR